MEGDDFEVSIISWTRDSTADTTNNPRELLSMPPESGFQLEYNNTKHSIVLQDVQIPQKAKDRLSLPLAGNHNSIISDRQCKCGKCT